MKIANYFFGFVGTPFKFAYQIATRCEDSPALSSSYLGPDTVLYDEDLLLSHSLDFFTDFISDRYDVSIPDVKSELGKIGSIAKLRYTYDRITSSRNDLEKQHMKELESLVAKQDNTLHNVKSHMFTLDSALDNQLLLHTFEDAVKTLQSTTGGVDGLERVDRITEELSDAVADSADVSRAIDKSHYNTMVFDDEDLERELRELQNGDDTEGINKALSALKVLDSEPLEEKLPQNSKLNHTLEEPTF
ncbi:hypothetical protein Ciccas_001890 [Cichlidogyrus casuarinus]|uniref:Uncharacterized protein n=1 Tax=Cichlidogyrus casuarinus TaxID=1844966 RepID=A0ABD2QJB1_9PLAT